MRTLRERARKPHDQDCACPKSKDSVATLRTTRQVHSYQGTHALDTSERSFQAILEPVMCFRR
jgi:hypothetical protein